MSETPDQLPGKRAAPAGYALTGTRWTDWLGSDYGQGDTIMYPTSEGSSSARMIMGVVLDLYHVKYGSEADWKWTRITEAEAAERLLKDPRSRHTAARIVVGVTAEQHGYASRSKPALLMKNDHVTLVKRWG